MVEIYLITGRKCIFELGNSLSVMLHDKSSSVIHAVPLNCSGLACTPVAAPVMMTPSDRKNSAARAVSSMLTSDVSVWELRKEHTYRQNMWPDDAIAGVQVGFVPAVDSLTCASFLYQWRSWHDQLQCFYDISVNPLHRRSGDPHQPREKKQNPPPW